MFCPSCGSEERQVSQFCRGCGTDLRAVRAGLERPDAITDAAATARGEIGRAIAAKIRDLKKPGDLAQITEEVLPEIEKFLESPEEKRLRRMRAGVMMSAIGLGAIITFMIVAMASGKEELLFGAGAGVVAFLIGLGMIINGKVLTIQKTQKADRSQEAALQNALDQLPIGATPEQRGLPPMPDRPLSVVEHTTHRLSNEPVAVRKQPPSFEGEN